MANVSSVLRLFVAAVLAMALEFSLVPSAWAAKKTTFANGPISVRICPGRCAEVKRHPYKTGGTATVYETRGGWARVSEHIDPARMSRFKNVPEKPAFWVRTRQLADPNISVAATPAPAPAPEVEADKSKKQAKAAVKKKPKRFVQRRKVTLPSFRPGTQVAALQTEVPDTAASVIKAEPPAEPNIEEPKMVKDEAPKVEVKKPEPAEQPKPVAEKKVAYQAPKESDVAEKTASGTEKRDSGKETGIQTLTNADKFITPAPKENEPVAVKSDDKPVTETPSAEAKVASLEPQPKLAEIVPLQTEERPKTFTKALRDKRLSALPGPKNKRFKREEVIAIRHHALMLLKNKECTGISGGGRSIGQSGMLYVVCKEDPSYLRQFPLEELSW